jgi:hypothetical protein
MLGFDFHISAGLMISIGNLRFQKHASVVVGVVAKFYYQPAQKISKRKFYLVLPEVIEARNQVVIPDFKR